MIDKTSSSPIDALSGIEPGAAVAVGGFGGCGIPYALIDALCDLDLRDLHIVSNNCGGPGDTGLAKLLGQGRIGKFTGSFPGARFAEQLLAGKVELDLIPQGTLAERLRAGGAGVPAFFTRTGVGTLLAEGGMVTRYDAGGRPLSWGERKETREFDGIEYAMERAITPDLALVHARSADTFGNLRFRLAARNFNPVAAMAASFTVVEAEHLLRPGDIHPDDVHLPGAFVDRVVSCTEVAADSGTTRSEVLV